MKESYTRDTIGFETKLVMENTSRGTLKVFQTLVAALGRNQEKFALLFPTVVVLSSL